MEQKHSLSRPSRTRVGFIDTFALRPIRERVRDIRIAFRGDPHIPPSRFGVSSLHIFKPSISLRTWIGRAWDEGKVPIYNLFNHTPTPVEKGWSVRVSQVEDFRGKRLTYDSHNGTDFAVPVGTPVVVSAPGRVLLITNEFHRGGLKIFVDHGQGLITTYNHMSRSHVEMGDVVERGQVIGLSGASGLEMLLCFPWVAPHIHYNVWLNGEYVDPFPRRGTEEISLWRSEGDPLPWTGDTIEEDVYIPTEWDASRVEEAIDTCLSKKTQERLRCLEELPMRAMATLMQINYFPGRWKKKPILYTTTFPRAPRLDLPLRAQDYAGVFFPDDPSSNK